MATTIEEYIELIKNAFGISVHEQETFPDILYGFYIDSYNRYRHLTGGQLTDYLITQNGITIKHIESYIFKVNDVYIEFDIEYDSWLEETVWHGSYFVEPEQQTITVYKKVN